MNKQADQMPSEKKNEKMSFENRTKEYEHDGCLV